MTKGSGDEGKCLDLFRVNRFSLGVLQRRNANRIVIVAWMCTWCCKTHCNSCINVEWDLCYWGGSRSTKPYVFSREMAASGDEGYLVCAAVAAAILSLRIGSPLVFCNVWLFMCA